MFAIRLDNRVLPDRYPSWETAVEAAQETHALPPEADWQIVTLGPRGDWDVCTGQG